MTSNHDHITDSAGTDTEHHADGTITVREWCACGAHRDVTLAHDADDLSTVERVSTSPWT